MPKKPERGAAAGGPPSGLDLLIEAEERIARRMREVRDAAAALVERARADAAAAVRGEEQAAAAEAERVAAELRSGLRADLEALEAERGRRVAALRSVDGERLAGLARYVVGRVIAGSMEETAP